jgi:uncharacterized membrane protein YeaQ/YmgE (transglycosylase-associated protein family)
MSTSWQGAIAGARKAKIVKARNLEGSVGRPVAGVPGSLVLPQHLVVVGGVGGFVSAHIMMGRPSSLSII